MIDEMNWGLDHNRFDVILIGANFLTKGVEPCSRRREPRASAPSP